MTTIQESRPIDLDDAWKKYKETVRNSSNEFFEKLASVRHGKSFQNVNSLMSYEIDVILTKHLNNFVTEITQSNSQNNERSSGVQTLQITNVCSINQVSPPSYSDASLIELKESLNILANTDLSEVEMINDVNDHNYAHTMNEEMEKDNFVSLQPLKGTTQSKKVPLEKPPRKVKLTGYLKKSGWEEDSNHSKIKIEKDDGY